MKPLTIGGLARQAGVNVETIRYYERRALLPEPRRTPGGYRQYADESVRRVRFIRRAQELGFTLREIQTLLSLRARGGRSCARVEARAEATIQRIEGKMAELERMRQALQALVRDCRAQRTGDHCPVLAALDDEPVS